MADICKHLVRSPGRRRRPMQSGAAAVEFALVFPLLIAILLAFVDFVFMMHDFAVITNAAREGARQGIVYKPRRTNAQITAVATNYANANLVYIGSGGSVAVAITPSAIDPPCANSGDNLRVQVTFTSGTSSIMYGIYKVVLGQIPFTASATMRCE